VGVSLHPVESFPDLSGWIHVHRNLGDVWDIVQDPVANLLGNTVPFGNAQGGIYRNVDLQVEPMADPAGAHLTNLTHPRDVSRGERDAFQHL
jgi:hypothetical protein